MRAADVVPPPPSPGPSVASVGDDYLRNLRSQSIAPTGPPIPSHLPATPAPLGSPSPSGPSEYTMVMLGGRGGSVKPFDGPPAPPAPLPPPAAATSAPASPDKPKTGLIIGLVFLVALLVILFGLLLTIAA